MDGQRSYRQYCGLARALDVVGGRWSLLVVRELLPGPRRYRELAASLGGIASNILTDRLRRLEAEGVLERRIAATGSVVYALTPRGAQLRDPIEALVRWSGPMMATGTREDDSFDPRWLAVALPALLRDVRPSRHAEVGIETRGRLLAVRVDSGGAHVAVEPDDRPATVVSGEPDVVLGLAAGAFWVDHPGITVRGDVRHLLAVFRGAA